MERWVPDVSLTERGFTQVELIAAIIILGILAAVAIPRFANRTTFDARGFYDGSLAALHYAQKSAVAQRRQVCVTFTAVTLTLTVDAAFSAGGCALNLTGPDGTAPYTVAVPAGAAGVAFNPVPANFVFFPSGAASVAQAVSVSGMAGRVITVDAVTGNVSSN